MNHFLETDTSLAKKPLKRAGLSSTAKGGKFKKPSTELKRGFYRGFASFSDIAQKHSKPKRAPKSMHIIHFAGGDVKLAWAKVGNIIKEVSDKEVKRIGGK